MENYFDISTPEMVLLGLLLFIGTAFIALSKEGFMIFAGIFVIGGVYSIVYIQHSAVLEKQFVLEQFKQGEALECGLWRGEGVLVDPNNGWRYEESIGFIKGDAIRNDPELCRVINKEAPEPPSLLYWAAFMTAVATIIVMRLLFRRFDKKTPHMKEETSHADTPSK